MSLKKTGRPAMEAEVVLILEKDSVKLPITKYFCGIYAKNTVCRTGVMASLFPDHAAFISVEKEDDF